MSMPSFAEFFRALWGYDPFPWQRRLACQIESGEWPEWITLPTGTGKTSTLDVAIYALALQADRVAVSRTAPIRVVFAVNRRIVVDEAFERARSIASKLAVACGMKHNADVDEKDLMNDERCRMIAPVAAALRSLASEPGAFPLEAYPLRGATYTDHAWTRSATQPMVITTTLDQLGSRLLFRGYGCSQGAQPMHAALLANDALLLLDEAHTAAAFSDTLGGVSRWRGEAQEPIRLPFAAVQLTATPPKHASAPFALDHDDLADPVIDSRLAAKKPVRLVEVEGAKGRHRHAKLATACEAAIARLLDPEQHPGVRRILVVVNRVATALQVRDTLVKSRSHGCHVELLTGGLRPLDRDVLVKRLVDRHQLQKPAPAADVPKLILIATQCVEVGADFDFDALITELAPLDSIRQRFGRLNRYGRGVVAPAEILAPQEALESGDEKSADPIYGTCLPAVWKWLKSHESGLDLGIRGFDRIRPAAEELSLLHAPVVLGPILLPAHLDLLCQTSPPPHQEPEPSLYIHGPTRDLPTVGVVVRSGLTESTGTSLLPFATEIVAALPPLAAEAATIRLHHARGWLEDDREVRDLDMAASDDGAGRNKQKEVSRPALRYANGEATVISAASELRPGDVLIVPTGTPDLSQLLPGSNGLLQDQLEQAHLLARDKVLLVLDSERLKRLREELSVDAAHRWDLLFAPLLEAEDQLREESGGTPGMRLFCAREWRVLLPDLIKLMTEQAGDGIWKWAAEAQGRSKWAIDPHPSGGIIARNPARLGSTPWPMEPDEVGSQGDGATAEVTLVEHQAGVERRLADICSRLGLAGEIVAALIDAARYHDVGKGDPRFQAWLHGTTVWRAAGLELIAKSAYPPSLRRQYRELSSTPAGFRHELLSTLIVAQSSLGASYPERNLLLHLIASHHGMCRACAPVVPDGKPEDFSAIIDGQEVSYQGRSFPLADFGEGVAERFWKLTRRFGWWGLAYLETLLRLADQRESASPTPASNQPS